MKKIAILLTQSPFDSALSREAHDMIMALAAVEHQVTVIYQKSAVLQLRPTHQDAHFGCKDFTPTQKLFALYDVAAVVASASALAQYQMSQGPWVIPVEVMTDAEIAELMAQQQQLLRF